MRQKPALAAATLLALALGALAAPAAANFHIMRIVQIYGGDATHPDAQYVEMQMCIAGQNELAGHTFGFFDAAGAAIGTVSTFPSAVPNGASQARVLLSTSSAATLFGLAPDLAVPARILTAGGKVCFQPGASPVDCIAWGNYSVSDATVGTPYDAGIGLAPGVAVQRDLTIAGGPTTLECLTPNFDDTNDSEADFDPVAPTPVNNANASGVLNTDHVFLHGFEAGTTGGWSVEVP
jgi:hypothetical protein